jgi:ubiquinone biosynthesis protein
VNPIRLTDPRLLLRLLAIVGIAGSHAVRTLPAALVLRIFRGRSPARRYMYRGLVHGIQRLGPTFVKFGQISSTRRDTMAPELCDEMSRLHDAVTAMTRQQADLALAAATADQPRLDIRTVDAEPVASGSIACVYRAVLGDGRTVALKLKRPNIDVRMRGDLALMKGMVCIAERIPKMRGMPMADLVGYMSRAILGQLDFAQEARNTERIRESVASIPQVRVPELYADLCAPNCLVFEYLPDLDAGTPDTLAREVREQLGTAVLAAVHKMFFVDGFVHCDLHPGNLYLSPDERVIILDAGYCVQLPDRVRGLVGEFFARMAAGDGQRCGEIVLESAVNLGPQTDNEGFIADMAELVARTADPGNAVDMLVFGNAVYELQQRHRIYAASDFAFPLMSLLVVEGTVRGLSPGIDFQRVGGAAVQAGSRPAAASIHMTGVP